MTEENIITETTAPEANNEQKNITIHVEELAQIAHALEIASVRGAYKENEQKTVSYLHDRLDTFCKAYIANAAQNQNPSVEVSPEPAVEPVAEVVEEKAKKKVSKKKST